MDIFKKSSVGAYGYIDLKLFYDISNVVCVELVVRESLVGIVFCKGSLCRLNVCDIVAVFVLYTRTVSAHIKAFLKHIVTAIRCNERLMSLIVVQKEFRYLVKLILRSLRAFRDGNVAFKL